MSQWKLYDELLYQGFDNRKVRRWLGRGKVEVWSVNDEPRIMHSGRYIMRKLDVITVPYVYAKSGKQYHGTFSWTYG